MNVREVNNVKSFYNYYVAKIKVDRRCDERKRNRDYSQNARIEIGNRILNQ